MYRYAASVHNNRIVYFIPVIAAIKKETVNNNVEELVGPGR